MTAQTRAPVLLAAWALAVSLIISRLGLVVHELGGHGVAALIAGGRITEVHLYTFGGGWISYGGEEGWSLAVIVAVSLAGIAVELCAAAALVAIVARRSRDDLAATGLAAAAIGLAIHAGFYLAAGTADGFGDGAALHAVLGARRWGLVVPVVVALTALAFGGGRRIGGELRGALPAGSRRRHALVLAGALAAAGLVHGGLVAGELALRPNPTYQQVMATARDRTIDDEYARWQADAARAGRAITPDERSRARRTIAARHPGHRLGPPLAVALGLAAALGIFAPGAGASARCASSRCLVAPSAGARRQRDLTPRAVGRASAIALATVILVVAIDVVAAAWC